MMNNELLNTHQQTVSAIMNKNVITVSVDDNILDVEKFITEHKLSFLPVMDVNNQCFGVISDHDFVKFHRYQGNSKLMYVWEICSHSVINIEADTSIETAAQLIIKNKIHHLIVSKNGQVIGVVSSIDLLRHFIRD